MGAGIKWPKSWSRDGRYILFTESGEGYDIGLVHLEASPPAKSAYLGTQFEELEGQISTDGRWVAYESNESGSREVYVQSFPVPGAKARVSTAGGAKPIWRRDGRAVFVQGADNGLFEAELAPDATNTTLVAAARRLFTVPGESYATGQRHEYEVASDGQRFLLNLVMKEEMPRGIVIVGGTPGGGR